MLGDDASSSTSSGPPAITTADADGDDGSTTPAGTDLSDDAGSGDESGGGTTTGGEAGHPDGLDPWLPDLDETQCPIEYPFEDAIDPAMLQPRTVCESGCDHVTLTEALAAAQPYDEILLAPGEYRECATVEVSPLVIRGDEGLAELVGTDCEPDAQVLTLRGAHIHLASLSVRSYPGTGVQLYPDVEQAVLTRVWFEDLDRAISGAPQELVLRQLKVKDVGTYNEMIEHQSSIISVNPQVLIVDRSVFSHYRERAWLMGLHNVPHIEIVCSVVAKVLGDELEANHSFHVFYPGDFLLTNNYIQEFGRIYHYMYNLNAPAANVIMRGNEFVLDDEQGDFVGNLQSSSVITAIDNTVIGGEGADALEGWDVGEVSGNSYIESRGAAGIDPYPALPGSWPVSQL